jgi:hypothetical protein
LELVMDPVAVVVRTECVVECAVDAVAASAGRATKTHNAVHAMPTVSGRISSARQGAR